MNRVRALGLPAHVKTRIAKSFHSVWALWSRNGLGGLTAQGVSDLCASAARALGKGASMRRSATLEFMSLCRPLGRVGHVTNPTSPEVRLVAVTTRPISPDGVRILPQAKAGSCVGRGPSVGASKAREGARMHAGACRAVACKPDSRRFCADDELCAPSSPQLRHISHKGHQPGQQSEHVPHATPLPRQRSRQAGRPSKTARVEATCAQST
eukprot:6469833-Amphidinium_carterae.2